MDKKRVTNIKKADNKLMKNLKYWGTDDNIFKLYLPVYSLNTIIIGGLGIALDNPYIFATGFPGSIAIAAGELCAFRSISEKISNSYYEKSKSYQKIRKKS